MRAICDKNSVDTSLLASLMKEEEIVDDGCPDGHHTGKAKSSDGTGANQCGKVGRTGRSNVAHDSDNNGNQGNRSSSINVRERCPEE
jgi:hypothetical protein